MEQSKIIDMFEAYQYLAITLVLLAGTSVIRPRREIEPGTATAGNF